MFIASEWKDYEVLDTGDGEKLERWRDVILRRPDPQAIWPKQRPELWGRADAHYHRSNRGGGEWEFFKKLPERWSVHYGELEFYVRPTGFKHTGLFPEQAVNWDWMAGLIRKANRPIRRPSGRSSGRSCGGAPTRITIARTGAAASGSSSRSSRIAGRCATANWSSMCGPRASSTRASSRSRR